MGFRYDSDASSSLLATCNQNAAEHFDCDKKLAFRLRCTDDIGSGCLTRTPLHLAAVRIRPMRTVDPWPTTRVTLLGQIRNTDDKNAWRAFVDLYAPIVYRYCRNRDIQHADAQNIAQEVFGRVSIAIRGFEYDAARGRFRGWLGLITHQQMLRYREKLARANTARSGTDGDFATSFEGEVEAAWTDAFNSHIYARAVEAIRVEVDDEEWLAFDRVWNQRERPCDVAQSLQKEPDWIYQLKHRLVNRLKEEIERLSEDVAILHRQ